MRTAEKKVELESIGCVFVKRECPVVKVDKWFVELDGQVLASSKWMGEAVWAADAAMGG